MWEFGKPPDVVLEIVSNTKGREADEKFQEYARIGARYYVIYDPQGFIQDDVLRVYELQATRYRLRPDFHLEQIGLELMLWDGVFEQKDDRWLRWRELDGMMILTGAERAEQERQRAEQEHQRAEQEHQRAERLAAQLQALGIEPEA
jgi:hypothetical protein